MLYLNFGSFSFHYVTKYVHLFLFFSHSGVDCSQPVNHPIHVHCPYCQHDQDCLCCLLSDESDEEEEDRPSRRRRLAEQAAEGGAEGPEDQLESIENLEDLRGHTVTEWVTKLGPRTEIYNRFKNFLRTYVDEKGHKLYMEKIRQMCEGELSRTS